MKKLLVIPALEKVSAEVAFDMSQMEEILLPIASRPLIDTIINTYKDYDILLISYFDFIPENYGIKKDIFVHKIEKHESFAKKIKEISIKFDPYDLVTFNFSYCILNLEPKEKTDCIFFAESDFSDEYCFFDRTENGIVYITEKTKDKNMYFAGIFTVCDVITLRTIFDTIVENSSFFDIMLNYYNRIYKKVEFVCLKNYMNLKKIEDYYRAKSMNFNSRAFNSLYFNGNYIRKISKENKLSNEINWHFKAPVKIKPFIPCIFDFKVDIANDKESFFEFEFFSLPVLDELFLYSNFCLDYWENIFKAIFDFIKIASETKPKNTSFQKESMIEMYFNKTISRLDDIIKDKNFSIFLDRVKINDVECFGIKYILDKLGAILDSFGIYNDAYFCFMHGDLCASNILYDRKTLSIKVIDPRGNFGKYDIFGDKNYDIAKLYQSFAGYYDFIVNNIFTYKEEYGCINYQILLTETHKNISFLFLNKLEKLRFDIKKIRFIESLLFLSMVSLHSDRPIVQRCFLAHGILKMNDLIINTDIL